MPLAASRLAPLSPAVPVVPVAPVEPSSAISHTQAHVRLHAHPHHSHTHPHAAHRTLGRSPRNRFYLPDTRSPGAGAGMTSESHRSSHTILPSLPPSGTATPAPIHRRPSRASLAALRSALQAYHVPSPPVEDELPSPPPHVMSTASIHSLFSAPAGPSIPEPITPQAQIGALNMDTDVVAAAADSGIPLQATATRQLAGRSFASLQSAFADTVDNEMMNALVEIHRVLYRGKEDLEAEGRSLGWAEQEREVKRVVERWFEGDCVYDHPLVQLSSRQALLAHFVLLHLFSTVSLPTLTPSSLLHHARTATSLIRSRWVGDDPEAPSDLEAAPIKPPKAKDRPRMALEEESLGLPSQDQGSDALDLVWNKDGEAGQRWWKVWDVKADCIEIGSMECYDGYHLAMIEHVVSLTLFPSLIQRRPSISNSSSSSSVSTLALTTSPSFLKRFAGCVAGEFEYLLHWDLPISTVVEFNEVGKATHVRDVIDVRDLIETFVPFAKRLNWLTRRVTGFFTSSIGSLALSLVPKSSVMTRTPIKVEAYTDPWERSLDEVFYGRRSEEPTIEGLGFGQFVRPADVPKASEDSENTLGLEGVGGPAGPAPDCDDEAQEG